MKQLTYLGVKKKHYKKQVVSFGTDCLLHAFCLKILAWWSFT